MPETMELHSGWTYHPTMELHWLKGLDEGEIAGNISRNGKLLSAYEAHQMFDEYLLAGYTHLPVCNRYDEFGKCKGHPPHLLECPRCQSDNLDPLEVIDDGVTLMVCLDCGNTVIVDRRAPTNTKP